MDLPAAFAGWGVRRQSQAGVAFDAGRAGLSGICRPHALAFPSKGTLRKLCANTEVLQASPGGRHSQRGAQGSVTTPSFPRAWAGDSPPWKVGWGALVRARARLLLHPRAWASVLWPWGAAHWVTGPCMHEQMLRRKRGGLLVPQEGRAAQGSGQTGGSGLWNLPPEPNLCGPCLSLSRLPGPHPGAPQAQPGISSPSAHWGEWLLLNRGSP